MLAPSGSNESNKFYELVSSTMPASFAAYRINCLCCSCQRAGTVNTHLILVLTMEPTYSDSFSIALSAMNLRDWEITVMRESSRPSTERAFLSIRKRWSL